MQNSKWFFLVIFLVAIIEFHSAVPVPDSKNQITSLRDTSLELDDLDLARSDEAGVSVKETAPKANPTRGKRTVGFLRSLFPNLSQIIDRKIQQITRVLFRVIGRLVLRGGNGGGGGDDGDKEGRKISITLPTYPPSEEDEEEEDETESPSVDSETEASSDSDSTTPADVFSEIPSLENADNAIAESQVITKIARKVRDLSSEEQKKESQNSNDVEQLDDKSSEDDDKPAKQEEDGKSKRVLFRFGGSGGASGNLLFDLIRLVAGSGATQEKDDPKSAALTDSDSVYQGTVVKEDGYSSGVPGPFTRLLILLNRSLSNVVQDIIIRLAQTSERLVTFKAKLITSVI